MPETSKKREKVRREVKIDKCPTVELGVQDTHLREKKNKNIEHLIPLKSLKCKEGMYPLKRAVELDFHHYFHHYHHSFSTHAHLDLTY